MVTIGIPNSSPTDVRSSLMKIETFIIEQKKKGNANEEQRRIISSFISAIDDSAKFRNISAEKNVSTISSVLDMLKDSGDDWDRELDILMRLEEKVLSGRDFRVTL